jgi:hypothetical protein
VCPAPVAGVVGAPPTVRLRCEAYAKGPGYGSKFRNGWLTAPVQRGFESRLIERSARDQLGGEATVDFLPRGVVCTVTCALDGAN